MTDKKSSESRRKLLKTIAAGGGAVISYNGTEKSASAGDNVWSMTVGFTTECCPDRQSI